MKKHIVIIMLLISGTMLAQVPEAPQSPREKFKNEMNLSEDQEKQIKAIKLDSKKEMLPLKNELGEKKARLRTLSTADKVNMTELDKCIDDIAALKAKMMKTKMHKHQNVRSLLNEDQRILFDTHHAEKMHKKMMHKEKAKQHKMHKMD